MAWTADMSNIKSHIIRRAMHIEQIYTAHRANTPQTGLRTRSPGGFASMMGVFWRSGPGGSSLPSYTMTEQSLSSTDKIKAGKLPHIMDSGWRDIVFILTLPVALWVDSPDRGWGRTDFAPEDRHPCPHGAASSCGPVRTSRAGCGRTPTCRRLTETPIKTGQPTSSGS